MSGGKSRFGFSWGSTQQTQTAAPERKGEVAELKNLLRDPAVEKDQARRREILKKVIAFMTLGVDTSVLFTDMILACITKDIVQKKMIYFYLTIQSESNAEQAILSINTLQKDCKDESPLVRGLAMRSLASLRLSQLTEYLVPMLKVCLVDTSPYVRKTAILATMKLFRIAPEQFRTLGLTEKMYGMLRDNDALVAVNALAVLQEVTRDDGGVNVSKQILYFLLNRLREIPEWHQPQILQLVLRYTPASEDEMFDIMNLVEERLRGSNSAVILASAHVFLQLTQNLPTVHKQVFDRLKEPLLTLMATSQSVETSYAVLCHIKLLVQRDPRVFCSHMKDFYCRHTDPTFMKSVKMEILTYIALESTCSDIVTELMAYVGDSNTSIGGLAIQCMCRIALRLEPVAKMVLDHFLELMAMDVEHVRGKTLGVMKDFLRKYGSISFVRPFLECIVSRYKDMAFEDDESKVALMWVLGEFGEHIEDAPYLMESMSANFNDESYALRTELLTSAMKLFFKRPPEMQPVLAFILHRSINDFSHADVHDRALLYYRLLKLNPRGAAQVVGAAKSSIQNFVEDDLANTRDKLFEEFDSLSVIYNLPSAVFQKALYEEPSEEDDEEEEHNDDGGDSNEDGEGAGLLSHNTELELSEDAAMDSAAFQKKWGKLETSATLQVRFKGAPDTTKLDESLEAMNIMTLAQGHAGGTTKVYLFAQPSDTDNVHILVELLIQATGQGSITVKSEDSRPASNFVTMLKKGLQPFLVG